MPEVITNNLDLWTSALLSKNNGGRGSNGKQEAYGIKKLRELILEFAVRGKLVPQDPNDEPADTCLTKARLKLRAEGKGARRSTWKETALVSADEKRFDLPKGWAWARVNDTGFYVNGLAFKPTDWVVSGKPIIRIQNLTDPLKPLNYARGKFPDEVTVRTGDLLVSWSATLDAFIWDRDEAVLNQHIFKVIPCYELVAHGFLYWLLKVSIRELEESEHAHGLAMTHINREPFLAHAVAIPPLAEQHRIVAKVNELMVLCDQLEQQQTHSIEAHQTLVETLLGTLTRAASPQELTEAWTRIANHFDTLFATDHSIDQLKQTILQLAVMGKLVPQDPNDDPASGVLERIANERRQTQKGNSSDAPSLFPIANDEIPFQLPDGWQWSRFIDVLDFQGGSQPPKSRFSDTAREGYVQLIQIRDLGPSPQPVFVPKDSVSKFCTTDDIMIGRYGASVGKVFWGRDGAYNVALIRLIDEHHIFEKRFLFNLMQSPLGQSYFLGISRSAQDGFSKNDIAHRVVPVPPMNEQSRIVTKVDELMALCDALKARLAEAQTTQIHLAGAIVEQAIGKVAPLARAGRMEDAMEMPNMSDVAVGSR